MHQVKAERMDDMSIEDMQKHTLEMAQKMDAPLEGQDKHAGTPNPDDAGAIKDNMAHSKKIMQSDKAPHNPL